VQQAVAKGKLTFLRRMARIESRSEVAGEEEALRRQRSWGGCDGDFAVAVVVEQHWVCRRRGLPAWESVNPKRLEEHLHTRSASIALRRNKICCAGDYPRLWLMGAACSPRRTAAVGPKIGSKTVHSAVIDPLRDATIEYRAENGAAARSVIGERDVKFTTVNH
jgi:hypothetical protein